MTDFQPVLPALRRAGTGCINQINDHLYEGRYSPMCINGKKLSRNVYAHTREECGRVLIAEMKAELTELRAQKAKGDLMPRARDSKMSMKSKKGK